MNTKRIFLAAATALTVLIASPFNSHAANGDGKVKATTTPLADSRLTVHYTGSHEDGLTFNVQFENPGAQKFWLIIKDNDGQTLFQELFSDVHFNKNVKFLRSEDDILPTFIIRSGKEEIKHTFSISRKVTENIVVTKL